MRTNSCSLVVLLCVLAACEKSEGAGSEGPYGAARAAWKAADLEVGELAPVEDSEMKGAKSCRSGEVAEIEVVVCEFEEPAAAKAAEERELHRIGDRTGLTLARDRLLLLAADPGGVDPEGKALNRIGKTFRALDVPPAATGEEDEGPEAR